MRRGRPTKAKEGSNVEQSSRMANTGGVTVKGPLSAKDQPKPSVSGAPWVIPKSATGDMSPPSKPGQTPDEQDLFARESAAGFGHSFASPPPDPSLQKNASAFGDSFNPSAAGKPVPTSFAARQKGLLGTTHGLRPTPVPSRGPSPPPQPAPVPTASWSTSVSAPAAAQGPSPSQRIAGSVASAAKAVDAQSSKILDVASRPEAMPLSHHSSHLGSSYTTSSGATDLGQSQVGPIDWRARPRARPELISRSSQTSPSLSEGLPPLSTVKARAAAYAAQTSSSGSKATSKPQRDLLDASDDDAAETPTIRTQWSGALDQRSQTTANKRLSMPIDTSAASLAAGRQPYKTSRPSAVEEAPEPSLPPRPRPRADTSSTLSSIPTSSSSSSSSEGPESADESPSKKFGHHEIPEVVKPTQPRASESSLLDTPNEMADTPRASMGRPAVGPKPVVTSPPSSLAPPQESSWPEQAGVMRRAVSDASEEEDPDTVTRRRAAIAKFAPSADSHPPTPPPVEPVEHRDPFATRAGDRAPSPEAKRLSGGRAQRQTEGPPLRAPKPQSLRNNAAITNLVSRYENLSASEPGAASPELDKQQQQPPAVPAKNVAGAGAPSSKRFSSGVDNFGRRFPPPESESSGGDRPRFRPTPSGRAASPPKAGPMVAAKRVHIPRQSLGPGGQLPLPSAALKRDEPSPLPSGGVQWEGKEGGQDEEERFAGVDSLKSRWERGAVKRAEQPIRAPREDYGVKS